MCGIYCVYKQSRSCQLSFCASPIFHFEIGPFTCYTFLSFDVGISYIDRKYAPVVRVGMGVGV